MDHAESKMFWDKSWGTFDPARIAAYAESLDPGRNVIADLLESRGAVRICDAGCGCGVHSLNLARRGFSVSGFDVAESAVLLAKKLLLKNGFSAEGFKQASILSTGYADSCFDAVVARDVLDHIPIADAASAVAELMRIVRPGGCVLLTLDASDDEYEAEPHKVTEDGDYVFTSGKWGGMVFHPYSPEEVRKLTAALNSQLLEKENGFIVLIEKPV